MYKFLPCLLVTHVNLTIILTIKLMYLSLFSAMNSISSLLSFSPSSAINTVGKWSSIWNFSLQLLGILLDINSYNDSNLLSFYSQVINSLIQLWHTASSSPLFNISASFVVVSHLQYVLQTYLRSLHHGTFSMNQGLLHLYSHHPDGTRIFSLYDVLRFFSVFVWFICARYHSSAGFNMFQGSRIE